MAFYTSQVGKVSDIIAAADAGKTSLAAKGVVLAGLSATITDAAGRMGVVNLNWDKEQNMWSVNVS